MTDGGGRCQRRRKTMAGGRGAQATTESKKQDSKNCPNLVPKFTEKPSSPKKIRKLHPSPIIESDFYTQALKALSFRSPFDSEVYQAPLASISGANTLPSGVSHFLNRHWDSRKRQKKSQLGSEKKSSFSGRPRGVNFWIETEEYFRELNVEDVERLHEVSNVRFSGDEKFFFVPSLYSNDSVRTRYEIYNGMLASACQNNSSSSANGYEMDHDGKDEVEGIVKAENDPNIVDVNSVGGENTESTSKEEKGDNSEKDFSSFSGIEWLLGSTSKIYLASERPSKKRKLLGRDAGLEKLLVAHPVEGSDSLCHYCSFGDTGNQLNCLIKCSSCAMVVHQRCYGVQEDVDSSWLCAWCKWKNEVGVSSERPCLLCSKQGGALKPVQKRGFTSESGGSEFQFAHLFCCQWMPEFYLENTRTMEPILNLDELKDTRRKLICYLCKVKCGACVRCSNGACRTSFHPICAREARHRMEIWGKLGFDEVELRAFCSKHSDVQNDSGAQQTGDVSLAVDSVCNVNMHQQMASIANEPHKLKISQSNSAKLAVHVRTSDADLGKLDGNILHEKLLDNRSNAKSQPESGDAQHPIDNDPLARIENEDVNASDSLNFIRILKKLTDLGKVDVRNVASEIGVSPDLLSKIFIDNHIVPELHCKVIKWMRNHAYISSFQRTLKVPVKSVPPRRRTKSNFRIVNDEKLSFSKEKINDDGIIMAGVENGLLDGEDSIGPGLESVLDGTKKITVIPVQDQDNPANGSLKIEDEPSKALTQILTDDCHVGGPSATEQNTLASSDTENNRSILPINWEAMSNSYIHPFIYGKLMQIKKGLLSQAALNESDWLGEREVPQLEASSSSGLCCNNHNLHSTCGDQPIKCDGVNLDQLVKARNVGLLKLSPEDEVEGELIYHQHGLLCNAVARKHFSDDLIRKVVRSLPQEIDAAGKRKWDDVCASQYHYELREAKKLGRKERRHKEAQAVLAAATAAAAASSRLSSIRKDALEEPAQQQDLLKMSASYGRSTLYSQLNPRVKEIFSRSAVARPSSDTNSDIFQSAPDFSREHPRTCDICSRSETFLNPILVCSKCKVAVHLDCYCSIKSSTGPWHCELCENLFSSRSSGPASANSWEKPYFVAECGLCGGTAGAFRKSVDGQWIHAFCAEWVLDSTFRRGQVNPIEGMETVCKGSERCIVCLRKHGVCLKCSYGHCQSTFHPTCARSAGFYMNVRTDGGKLQHKAYCEKHSMEQRSKADIQRYGVEEFKGLKQIRVELERLRLLCERIVKREKLKRELALCSHGILASSRDTVLSALARHPFYQPDVSSESATTSIKGYTTDDYKPGSEIVQIADDMTVDSTTSGKRRVKLSVSTDNDGKTDDSSTSQNLSTPKPIERISFSGKQIPQRLSVASRNVSDDTEKRSKYRKHTETLAKELVMTSDQASMKNQRLPKGFVYVPIRSLPKDKETTPDLSSQEPVEQNG
ncbi:histone-lysine n-methyltransferase atx1 [Olea europaea subsp. europaea]|uniref:Histone-lysine n-methyltransferase atx1 n=1 Tax=Olea europaea subsp. europaea TaxID=158383 RepID=A0A8S0VJ27_OLEEU|nr:histone-lysine n-methyltransferase atx1 [Olea europaea subsp. europaea]